MRPYSVYTVCIRICIYIYAKKEKKEKEVKARARARVCEYERRAEGGGGVARRWEAAAISGSVNAFFNQPTFGGDQSPKTPRRPPERE